MNRNARSIRRTLPVCAIVLIIMALFAAPRLGRTETVKCGPETPFGLLCAEVSFTRYATSPGFARITNLFSNPFFALPAIEADIGLTSPQVGSAFADTTFAQERAGIIGADDSIPHAFWIRQGYLCLPNCVTPVGILALFNSIGSPPIGYANALIVGDPPPATLVTELDDLVSGLGGNPSSLSDLGNLSSDSLGVITPPTLPGFAEVPEPSYLAVEMLAAACMVIAVYQRRRRIRQVTGRAGAGVVEDTVHPAGS
jgi:hypothetical protein